MDLAEAERLLEILRTQEACLIRQEAFQSAMAANMGHLSSHLEDLMGQLARPGAAASTLTISTASVTTMHAESHVNWHHRLRILGKLGFV